MGVLELRNQCELRIILVLFLYTTNDHNLIRLSMQRLKNFPMKETSLFITDVMSILSGSPDVEIRSVRPSTPGFYLCA